LSKAELQHATFEDVELERLWRLEAACFGFSLLPTVEKKKGEKRKRRKNNIMEGQI
jgi:hypothetical protein